MLSIAEDRCPKPHLGSLTSPRRLVLASATLLVGVVLGSYLFARVYRPADWVIETVRVAVPAVKVTVPVLAGPVFEATWMLAIRPVGPIEGVTFNQDVSEATACHSGWLVVTVTLTDPAVLALV